MTRRGQNWRIAGGRFYFCALAATCVSLLGISLRRLLAFNCSCVSSWCRRKKDPGSDQAVSNDRDVNFAAHIHGWNIVSHNSCNFHMYMEAVVINIIQIHLNALLNS